MISHDLKCIFIHIPKCAGSSINNHLKLHSLGFSGHSPASSHSEYIKDYFSFTFVRNPYDRVASAYKYFQGLRSGHRWYQRNKIISDQAALMSFHEFVNHIPDFMELMQKEEGSFRSGLHFQPFSYFLDDDIDYIGKFENIQLDYYNIRKALNLDIRKLPTTNTSDNKNYKDLYNRHSRDTVYNLYKDDIIKFSYNF